MDYLVVSLAVALMVEEEAFLEISLADFLTLSDLERCSGLLGKKDPQEQEDLLQDLRDRLVFSSMVGPRAQA